MATISTKPSFTQESITFLGDLTMNNDRDWFQDQKEHYQSVVAEPAKVFMGKMQDALGQLTRTKMSGKTFRIYRDVRFSKDKTPYNPHVRMIFRPEISEEEEECTSNPGFYFSLGMDEVIVGVGSFQFEKESLKLFRAAIAEEPKKAAAIQTIIADCQAKGYRLGEPKLKNIPPGYNKEAPHAGLLRHKGLALWNDIDPKVICSDQAIERCISTYQELIPFYQWLAALT
ncbi:DUF2461 domain-containing protein [bacterium]|jgi:uncharacterized protein (TIGR02453 family)|nr:DUF2461 domain-containing protein [bacterium]